MMSIRHPIRLLTAALIVAVACSDGGTDPEPGPPAQLVAVVGNNQSAFANTNLTSPIVIEVRDLNGITLGAGHEVTFSIVAGGGAIIGAPVVVSDVNGRVTGPTWRLGKSALPQTMRGTLGTIQGDFNANVSTQYGIAVRFFGDPMTPAQEALFQNAAARIRGFIIGDIADASYNGNLADDCGSAGSPVTGLPTSLNETVDDIVIYAAITTMDGPGNVLGQATPCLGRDDANGLTQVAYGFMKFDIADFASIANQQEVIVHEMLHVVGSGTLWETDRALITGKGGADPRFTGPLAREACAAFGASVSCGTSVPLENTGGTGTRDFHWRETTFNNEIMTGFYNSGTNPLSTMTIASIADLGLAVNNADFDTYNFVGAAQASIVGTPFPPGWEQVSPLQGIIRPDGRVERITR